MWSLCTRPTQPSHPSMKIVIGKGIMTKTWTNVSMRKVHLNKESAMIMKVNYLTNSTKKRCHVQCSGKVCCHLLFSGLPLLEYCHVDDMLPECRVVWIPPGWLDPNAGHISINLHSAMQYIDALDVFRMKCHGNGGQSNTVWLGSDPGLECVRAVSYTHLTLPTNREV